MKNTLEGDTPKVDGGRKQTEGLQQDAHRSEGVSAPETEGVLKPVPTDVFRERYRKRSGIEATNSMLKRVTGMGRLRIRGSPGVFHSILLKVAGWNLFQAARTLAMRKARRFALAAG